MRGVLQAYAFNEVEAVRMFKAALAQDPRCAMCAWGVAWQLGPNINDTSRARVPQALPYLELALQHAATATPRERALIEALALRYAHASQAVATAPLLAERCGRPGDDGQADPLDAAYADRLHAMVLAAPNDPELLSLWAEAWARWRRGRRTWSTCPRTPTSTSAAMTMRCSSTRLPWRPI